MGDCNYDHHNECVVWSIETVNSDANAGTLELSASCDESSIFPLTLEAAKEDTYLDLQILEAYHMTSKDALKYAQKRTCNFSFMVER